VPKEKGRNERENKRGKGKGKGEGCGDDEYLGKLVAVEAIGALLSVVLIRRDDCSPLHSSQQN